MKFFLVGKYNLIYGRNIVIDSFIKEPFPISIQSELGHSATSRSKLAHLLCIAAFIFVSTKVDAIELATAIRNVPYGSLPSQQMDIFLPPDERSLGAVIYVHGGGWWGGDKKYIDQRDVKFFNSRQIVVVSINYRNLNEAVRDNIFPPILAALSDTRAALIFLRESASKYHFAPDRIAIYGGSAGGYNALWVGLTGGKACVKKADQICDASTTVTAIGGINAPTTIDPWQIRDWVGANINSGGHAFGLTENRFDLFLRDRDKFTKYFSKISPSYLVNAESPNILLYYTNKEDRKNNDHMYLVHSPGYGFNFKKIADEKGASVKVIDDGDSDSAKKLQLLKFLADSIAP